ncbi:hypothetical protein Nepgr_033061 [Nepenthes gracilis]|uniref:Secreted protein n=1 Tax=Nepenthes gracilis TaxID=150966 RepID=A0AAD3TJU9_NEPGR|nr:hypothetical protein Nepgr_033061 [Nepenthes gracilis]
MPHSILLFLLWVLNFDVLSLDELVFCCPWNGCSAASGGMAAVLVLRMQLSTIYHPDWICWNLVFLYQLRRNLECWFCLILFACQIYSQLSLLGEDCSWRLDAATSGRLVVDWMNCPVAGVSTDWAIKPWFR